MKKRSKVLLSLALCVLCLGFLVYGVIAAATASLSINSTINFKAVGVWVKVDCDMYAGETPETLQLVTNDGVHYSEKNYASVSEQDLTPDGSASNPNLTTWAPAFTMDDSTQVVEYRISFTNYTNVNITAIPSNLTSVNANKLKMFEMASNSLIIAPNATEKFTLQFRVQDFSTAITNQVQVNFEIVRTEKLYTDSTYGAYNLDYFTISNNQITGLTEAYTSLQTKPSILIIPATDASDNALTLGAGTSSAGTFNGLASKYVIVEDGITTIPNYAFNQTSIVATKLPNSVLTIGEGAFRSAESLNDINMPSTLTAINNFAFMYCTSLAKIVIPNTINKIGQQAFDSCTSLTSVTIPSTVTSFQTNAFRGCSSLSITVDPNHRTYSSLNGSLYNKNQTTLYSHKWEEHVTDIPDTVTTINGSFYGCTILKSVILPKNLNTFLNNPFYRCTNLESITIPSGVTNLPSGIFSGCSKLINIYIEGSAPAIPKDCLGYATNFPYRNANFKIYVKNEHLASYQQGTSENVNASGTSVNNWYYYQDKIVVQG